MSSPRDSNSHSDPIPINATPNHRKRSHSTSESSESDSIPPLSPSESPTSTASINIQTPFSSTSRIPLSPVSPSSPILSYFYGSPTKTPFNRVPTSSSVFQGQLTSNPRNLHSSSRDTDEDSQEQPPSSTGPHTRRLSTSWIPVRFGPQQQNPPVPESQQDRGAGVLRRLSLSGSLTNKPPTSAQARSITPPKQDGGTRPDSKPMSRGLGQRRKAATLSAGTVDAGNKARAPSPMGERMLKGHYDGF